MRKFIAIGGNHRGDNSEYIKEILGRHKPDAVSLERHLCSYDQGLFDALHLGTKFESYVNNNGYLYFKVSNHLVSMREDCPELFSATQYALEQNIPFYFIELEWKWGIEDKITKWADGKVETISIHTSSHNFSKENKNPVGKINARNQFMGDALNYLFNIHKTIAHIGGRYHFQSNLPLPKDALEALGDERLSPDMELQHLVRAKQKYVYDAVLRKRIF